MDRIKHDVNNHNCDFVPQSMGIFSPVHKNARFHGWEQKNWPAVHEKGGFRGQGPGYLLYLHDLGVILSESEGFV